ncbi:TetR/AcrR family transcriptional regulator [Sphingorhabdus sp.]|jgi:AcrR family transcriptional regulator|uniref:TetR/AcrR family transcriptional regulator n=1 Tax=Sphingorhabdus sp. TaxID=1902408 RepID=UPI0037CB3B07
MATAPAIDVPHDVQKPAGRRMGAVGGASWSAMLDAAEHVLSDEGYAALSSRRIAEVAGFKQRLVYYYFQSMDALVTAMFRRMVARETERLKEIAASARPIRNFWELARESRDTRLSAEFLALAHRNAELNKEVVDFITFSRQLQITALEKATADRSDIPASAMVVLGTNLALSLNREAALGVDLGHAAAETVITEILDRIEP